MRPFAEIKYIDGMLTFIGAHQHRLLEQIRKFETHFDADDYNFYRPHEDGTLVVEDEAYANWLLTDSRLNTHTRESTFLARKYRISDGRFTDNHDWVTSPNLLFLLRIALNEHTSDKRGSWVHVYTGAPPITAYEMSRFMTEFKATAEALKHYDTWYDEVGEALYRDRRTTRRRTVDI